jgi:hypothetical protein
MNGQIGTEVAARGRVDAIIRLVAGMLSDHPLVAIVAEFQIRLAMAVPSPIVVVRGCTLREFLVKDALLTVPLKTHHLPPLDCPDLCSARRNGLVD